MTVSSRIISKVDVKDFVYSKAKSTYKILAIINRPEINVFLIGLFFVLIILYSFININYKRSIAELVSSTLITCISLIIVILISYINFPLGLLLLVGYFVIVYPVSNDASSSYYDNKYLQVKSNIGKRHYISEGFENESIKDNSAVKSIEDKEKDDELVDSIKNSITKGMTDAKKKGDDDLKALMLQNSKLKLKNEKKNSSKNNTKTDKSNKSNKSDNGSSDDSSDSSNNIKKVEKRKFNPSNQDDTNLMITKEIISDMLNRIEYKYEDTPYLKKYLRHRIEDIIETNDLLDDDE